jgi:hypothetical protein
VLACMAFLPPQPPAAVGAASGTGRGLDTFIETLLAVAQPGADAAAALQQVVEAAEPAPGEELGDGFGGVVTSGARAEDVGGDADGVRGVDGQRVRVVAAEWPANGAGSAAAQATQRLLRTALRSWQEGGEASVLGVRWADTLDRLIASLLMDVQGQPLAAPGAAVAASDDAGAVGSVPLTAGLAMPLCGIDPAPANEGVAGDSSSSVADAADELAMDGASQPAADAVARGTAPQLTITTLPQLRRLQRMLLFSLMRLYQAGLTDELDAEGGEANPAAYESAMTAYMHSLLAAVRHIKDRTTDVLAQFMLDAPALPDGCLEPMCEACSSRTADDGSAAVVVARAKQARPVVAESAPHEAAVIACLRDLVMWRPLQRAAAVDALLALCVAPSVSESARQLALRVVAKRLMAMPAVVHHVVDFARRGLRSLHAPPAGQHGGTDGELHAVPVDAPPTAAALAGAAGTGLGEVSRKSLRRADDGDDGVAADRAEDPEAARPRKRARADTDGASVAAPAPAITDAQSGDEVRVGGALAVQADAPPPGVLSTGCNHGISVCLEAEDDLFTLWPQLLGEPPGAADAPAAGGAAAATRDKPAGQPDGAATAAAHAVVDVSAASAYARRRLALWYALCVAQPQLLGEVLPAYAAVAAAMQGAAWRPAVLEAMQADMVPLLRKLAQDLPGSHAAVVALACPPSVGATNAAVGAAHVAMPLVRFIAQTLCDDAVQSAAAVVRAGSAVSEHDASSTGTAGGSKVPPAALLAASPALVSLVTAVRSLTWALVPAAPAQPRAAAGARSDAPTVPDLLATCAAVLPAADVRGAVAAIVSGGTVATLAYLLQRLLHTPHASPDLSAEDAVACVISEGDTVMSREATAGDRWRLAQQVANVIFEDRASFPEAVVLGGLQRVMEAAAGHRGAMHRGSAGILAAPVAAGAAQGAAAPGVPVLLMLCCIMAGQHFPAARPALSTHLSNLVRTLGPATFEPLDSLQRQWPADATAVPVWDGFVRLVKALIPSSLPVLVTVPAPHLRLLLTAKSEAVLRDRFRAWFATWAQAASAPPHVKLVLGEVAAAAAGGSASAAASNAARPGPVAP